MVQVEECELPLPSAVGQSSILALKTSNPAFAPQYSECVGPLPELWQLTGVKPQNLTKALEGTVGSSPIRVISLSARGP